jgi:hypothetical protein
MKLRFINPGKAKSRREDQARALWLADIGQARHQRALQFRRLSRGGLRKR